MSPLIALLAGCVGNDVTAISAVDPDARVHRLNNHEYDAVMGDLFTTAQRPARRFPTNAKVAGFDNNAASLPITPTFLDLHELAIEDLLDEFFYGWSSDPVHLEFEAEGSAVDTVGGKETPLGHWMLSDGDLLGCTVVTVPEKGYYDFHIASIEGHGEVAFYVDSHLQTTFSVDGAATHTFEVFLDAGMRGFELSLVDDDGGGVHIDSLVLEGPHATFADASWSYDAIVSCDPADGTNCVKHVVADFGQKAWRRDLTSDEVESLVGIWRKGDALGLGFDDALRWSLKAVLMSPEFLFRIEDPAGSPGANLLSGPELASRLSFFLWSSGPDEQLLALGANGMLQRPEVIKAEVIRMLADPRAEALIWNLAGQWWGLRALAETPLENEGLTNGLRIDMVREMEHHARRVLLDGAPMTEALTYQSTFASPRLAGHYGISTDPNSGWGTVDLSGSGRQGLLMSGGWLTITTGVVFRGKSILENFLCEETSPPPAEVTSDLSDEIEAGEGSYRERLETARTFNEPCTGCHAVIDPLGFPFDEFDAAGKQMDVDRFGYAFDTSGALPSGTAVSGARDLSSQLATDPKVARCMVQKTYSYALGRKPGAVDWAAIDSLAEEFVANDHSFQSLVVSLTTSELFRTHRGSP